MKKIFLLFTLTILLTSFVFAGITDSTITGSVVDDEVIVCADDVEECSDGSFVSRNPYNDCKFNSCPEDSIVCADDVEECSDGSFVSRNPYNDCKFNSCPEDKSKKKVQDVKQTQIQKAIQTKNRLRIGEGECPIDCTCTGSVTKCQLEGGGREMTISAGKSGNTIVQVKGVNMSTKVELYQSEGEVYGVFKDNNTKRIKIMPDEIQTRLTERIGGLEEHEIELDEDGAYQVQAKKRARLFGLFPVKKRVRFEMNSETGEIIRERTSWWGFLAKDELIVGNNCATVSPDSREECCQNKGFDSYNQETGECKLTASIDEIVE